MRFWITILAAVGFAIAAGKGALVLWPLVLDPTANPIIRVAAGLSAAWFVIIGSFFLWAAFEISFGEKP